MKWKEGGPRLESGRLDPDTPLSLAWKESYLGPEAVFTFKRSVCLDCGLGSQDVGRGYLAVLTIFTILEFFIAVIATHFGCQATRAQTNAVSTLAPSPEPVREPDV